MAKAFSPDPAALAAPAALPSVQLKSVGLHPLIYRKRIFRADRQAGEVLAAD